MDAKIFTPILNYLKQINTKIYLPAPNKNVYMDISSIPNIPDTEKETKELTKLLTVLLFPLPINISSIKAGEPVPAPIITAGKSSFGKSSTNNILLIGIVVAVIWYFMKSGGKTSYGRLS